LFDRPFTPPQKTIVFIITSHCFADRF